MKQIAFAVIAVFAILGTASYASAIPFDFIVSAKAEQDQIEIGQKPVVFGSVTDGVLRPVSGVTVKITFGANSQVTTTDQDGKFRSEFPEQTSPGTFSVTVFAKQDTKKGFGSTTLRISKQATTFGDIYYNSNLSTLASQKNDPYQALKLKNYEKFLEEKKKAFQKQMDIEAKKITLQEKKSMADQSLNKTITELAPGPGSFSGYKYDRYISGLNPSVKDKIVSQIDYTKNTIEEAKAVMKKVLDNGGTLEDAQKAYFEKLSINRESMEKIVNVNATENHSKIKKHAETAAGKKVKGLTVKNTK